MLKTCSAMEILKKHGGGGKETPHKAMGGLLNNSYQMNKMAALPKKSMYKKGGNIECKAMGGAAKVRKDFPYT